MLAVLISDQGLHEKICSVFVSQNILQGHYSISDCLSYKMLFDLYMSGTSVQDRVFSKSQC